MKRVFAYVPLATAAAVLLLATTSVAASAGWDPDPNPNNHGHHNGWYKPGHKGAPAPNPNPNPNQNPAPPPKGGGTTNAGPQTGAGTGVPAASPAAVTVEPDWAQLLAELQGLSALDLVATADAPPGRVNFVASNEASDPLWWLILLLPPTLAALLVIAIRGLVRRKPAAGAVSVTRTAAAGSPAL